jgi:GNAT superfamily N-acetyltransferase
VIRDAQRDELAAIQRLLGRANDTPYDLAAVAAEKCFGDGVAGAPRVRVHGDFEGVAVTCGRYLRLLAVDPARRRQGVGTALLRDAEEHARIVGAEAGNYFTPGVPEPLADFFLHRGYVETARTQNLIASTDFEAPAGVRRASRDERERVLAFIDHEFGSSWRFEAARAFDAELPTIFVADDDGVLTGFSAHEANNRGLGTFGPTGVAHAARGRGIGTRLLLASLADLRRLGYARAVIPWTDAVDYYRRGCGAEVAERFVTLARAR